MPLHVGDSLKNLSLNIQSKLITKLVGRATSGPLRNHQVLTSSSLQNLNDMYDFIALQDSEETAKTVVNNSVAIMCKVAVVLYNDLFTEREEDIILELFDIKRNVIESFLEEAEKKTGNYDTIMCHLSVMEDTTISLLRARFSEKTLDRAKVFFGYFEEAEVFHFLFTDPSAENFLDVSKTILKENLSNIELNTRFIKERRNKKGTMKKLTKMSKDIQAAQFAKMATETGTSHKDPSEDMIGQKVLTTLSLLKTFIEFQSKDERKADELIENILTIVAKLEAGFAADIFTDEDQIRLMDLVGAVRDLIDCFLGVRTEDPNTVNKQDFSELLELYEVVEEKLCELLKPHFGGNTLTRVKSLFYYFKKPEVNMFYFVEMQDSAIIRELATVLRHAYNDIPSRVLCEPPSNTD